MVGIGVGWLTFWDVSPRVGMGFLGASCLGFDDPPNNFFIFVKVLIKLKFNLI